MGVLAAIGLGVVVWVRSQPVAERQQRLMGVQLSLAYQKFRFDNKSWPTNAMDAAEGFRTENEQLGANIEKAQKEWGMSASMVDPESDKPMLKIVFEKPAHYERLHALYKDKPMGAGSGRVSAAY